MFSHRLIQLFLIWVIVGTAMGAATCYFPSGTIATGNVPCNNGTEFSSCCGSADGCLANGLCLVNNDQNTIEFGRGGCTDPTWSSPNCFQHCTVTPDGLIMTNGAAVFECDSTGYSQPADYCCETGPYQKDSCCTSTPSKRFKLRAGTPVGQQVIIDGNGGSGQQGGSGGGVAAISSIDIPQAPVSDPLLSKTLVAAPKPTQIPTTSNNNEANDAEPSSQTSSTDEGFMTFKTSTSITSKSTSTSVKKTTPTNTPTQVSGSPQTSSSSAPNVSPVDTGMSDSVKIAIGVAVPAAVLLAALLVFLIWNNHRNSKKIRSLQSDLNSSRSPAPSSYMSSPIEPYSRGPAPMSEIGATHAGYASKPLPGYPRHEYYKPQPYHRPMHELSGGGRPSESHQAVRGRTHELDSTPQDQFYQGRRF